MDYKTELKHWAARRQKIIAMAERKGPRSYSIVARTFKISRQRVQQIVAAHKANGR